MTACPDEVAELVERFERNRQVYLASTYNEAQVRREFIDPLFRALGWDVDNKQGLAEAYKDVIHEDAIKVGGVTKAPDYCFRIGGTRKFFVEAKKPGVALDRDPEPAYQLRRYAWTSKLPLSILTDFEEFAVYDCRIRPHRDDPVSTARVFYCRYRDYPDKWPWIAEHFSKDAILKGAFDRYAESTRRKRGTAEVDEAFLAEIEGWRERLAANFALRNPGLSVRDLNFAVQRTVDRIIFLRLCEDRCIEPYGQLLAMLNGDRVYERLGELFRRADERYNSSLFYFSPERGREPPDEVTLSLRLDDKVLKDIIRGLYYPDCPYEFSVLPPEILGQVYERFLGKVIRLTPGHRAKVEDKPEVRKAGGVYYTPKYIVDYIVQHTVGKSLEGQTPAEIGADACQNGKRKRPRRSGRRDGPVPDTPGCDYGAPRPLRILDPACGSGSFLLGAYQYLLDWYRDAYVKQIPPGGRIPAALTDRIYQGPGGQWRLTIREKKRILLNHIYGVDIDPQAVEVTKLSLLLKVLEGETTESIDSMLRLFHERALPDLDKNIKCGNSLIGPDFYEGRQLSMFDEEERLRINAFDWHAEFPQVFPRRTPEPSRARKEAELSPAPEQSRDRNEAAQGLGVRQEALQRRASASLPETHPLSDGRGSDPTLAPDAGFDVVIGNPPYGAALSAQEAAYVRARFTAYSPALDSYVLFIERAIAVAGPGGLVSFIVPTGWYTGADFGAIRRYLATTTDPVAFVNLPYDVFPAWVDTTIFVCRKRGRVLAWPRRERCPLRLTTLPKRHRVVDAAELSADYCEIELTDWFEGGGDQFLTFADAPAQALIRKVEKAGEPLARFADVQRGVTPFQTTTSRTHPTSRPAFRGSVRRYRLDRGPRAYIRFDETLAEPKPGRYFVGPRILLRELISRQFRLQAVKVEEDFVTNKSMQSILPRPGGPHLNYILGILNSRLISWYFLRKSSVAQRDDFPKIVLKESRSLPVVPVRADDSRSVQRHERLVRLVQQILDLHERLAAAKTPHEKTALQRQIEAMDRQIDQLVYELYGLTEDEIRIVEEATQ